MDSAKGSIISLSSASSHNSPVKSESVMNVESASIITVSSEPQRVPVSWESSKSSNKEDPSDFEQMPNHLEKVSNWMTTCVYEELEYPEPLDFHEENQTTCIRYDFDKKPPSPMLPHTCYTESTPLVTYLEETKKSPKSPKKFPNNGESNGSSVQHSPNPDTQKIELCSYLQLMKPEDSKENNFYIEYRRSGRVKTQLNQKKEKLVCREAEEIRDDLISATASILKEKVKKVFSLKRKADEETLAMPLPPKEIYAEITDFEDSIKPLVDEDLRKKPVSNGCLKKVSKPRRFKFGLNLRQKLRKTRFRSRRIISLRSNGRLKNISLDNLLQSKTQIRKKARKKLLKNFKGKGKTKKLHVDVAPDSPKDANSVSPGCEIVSVHASSDDENVDLRNFVDDMLELDKMSEEHRKSVIESRILASSSITNLINKRGGQGPDVQKAYKIFSDLSKSKSSEEKENHEASSSTKDGGENVQPDEENIEEEALQVVDQSNLVIEVIVSEHDYASYHTSEVDDEEEEDDEEDEKVDDSLPLTPVPLPDLRVLPVNEDVQSKSLQGSLTTNSRRRHLINKYGLHNWSAGANCNKKLSHAISLSEQNGSVLRAFYQEYNLVIAQERLVSVWTQSALGNVLGAQNMWIPKGEIQRIALDGTNNVYTQKGTADMVITTETSIAFVELWTKEHKSEVREVPLADVFATVYFWRVRQNGLSKKALQLERIQGFAEDVQYCILTWYPKIIVSWHSVQGTEKKTKIRSYHLATDFQTVANISEIQPVQHYVDSLHNVEDGDSLVMGCGENKITLWNVEYGYVVATIEMSSIQSPLSTLWVKCDRGFLFVIQECTDQELRLIAINGMNHSWKKLQGYIPPSSFNEVKGVCIDKGIVVAYYAQGLVCWNSQTGDLIAEEVTNECKYIPCGKNVIMLGKDNIMVRHSLSHLVTDL